MNDKTKVVRLDRHRARKRAEKAKGRTLCDSGFHRWEISKEKRFDVRQGRLVTVRRCARCGAQRVTAD